MAKARKGKRPITGGRKKGPRKAAVRTARTKVKPNNPAGTHAVPREAVSSNPPGDELKLDRRQPIPEGTEPSAVKGLSAPATTVEEKPPADSSTMPLEPDDTQKTAGAAEAVPGEKAEMLELLAFQLADEEYAIDLLMIREIIRSVEITSVPRTVPFIKGIISLRGMIIPIFDLRTRLRLAEAPISRQTRILVVTLEKGLMGLIADRVNEVVKVRTVDVEPPPGTVGEGLSGHLNGVCHLNDRLLILLNLEKAVGMK